MRCSNRDNADLRAGGEEKEQSWFTIDDNDHAFTNADRRCPFGLPEVLVGIALASVLQGSWESANTHARSGAIRGIPA